VQGEVGFDLLLPSEGRNVLGVWGFGTNVYFADSVSLLVGTVFFLDSHLQPGSSKYMWSAQLDIDIPFGK
jgi:hypothetical protein